MKIPELLVPAGNLEKLKMAIHCGADAVYLSGKHYGLRTYAGNFTLSEMEEAMMFARSEQVKVYVTLNIIARNSDMNDLPDYLSSLSDLAVDGLIISDPGIIAHARQIVPHIPIHVSTQLSTSNWSSASFWQQQGITRVNLARELSLEEIAFIKQKVSLELEIFIHGSLCISHSGRCLLSTYLAHRDSNRGACAHPCRWKYALMEENRPGVYFPISEDEHGSYIFNAKDLCLIAYLPEIIATGVDALKIEGRMKGINYVGGVTRIYRHALDCYRKNPEKYQFQQQWMEELKKLSHRDYTTGFALDAPSGESYNYATSEYIRTHTLVGVVREISPFRNENSSPDAGKQVKIQVRNKIVSGDEIEFITKELKSYHMKLGEFTNGKGEILRVAQPGQEILLRTDLPVNANDLIRKKRL
jgi:putative protease